MTPLTQLEIAAVSFVGSHVLLSHPLRKPLVKSLGEKGFLGIYSLIAFATLGWMVWSARQMPIGAPKWEAGPALWIVATLLVWLGSILFVGSHKGNPAMPRPGATMKPVGEPWGVFRITRHPMMWSFGLWAIAHAIVNATPSGLVIAEAIGVLALAGAALQDRKKSRILGATWDDWASKTSFVPFGRGLAWPGTVTFVAGTVLFLVATWAHQALGYRPAGFWAF